ncbi:MAG TPA: hypothetical protein VFE79_11520 [Paraburkholderia sp.]|jgi:nucleoside-diphosphate-sugar epimerase|nr:hypothetical protein [Paraburkholderia sp.]
MAHGSGDNASCNEPPAEALQALAEYLELSLDTGASLVIMRHTSDVATLYLGDPTGPREALKRRGTIAASLANQMLAATEPGKNLIEIDGRTYRFFRSFTHIDDAAAIVFSTT